MSNNIIATKTDDRIKDKLLNQHKNGKSIHSLAVDAEISETCMRSFLNGKPVSEKIMRELRVWDRRNK